ncbi:hypothetical protein DSO57_1030957 [Entomophthora muscae]|uniref:Uncharacterized protein n=1 Tax=Entomophthora muscae TaxID=34485 RepID=A0ACC2UAL0_9FUNG|nr:hypothetical protein DSO57_1030957 [Entomophthora muscae]
MKKVNVIQRFATAYNPCCNGLTKKFNKTLVATLKKCTGYQSTLREDTLPAALQNYCAKVHSMTKVSPFEVIYRVKLPEIQPPIMPRLQYMNGLCEDA